MLNLKTMILVGLKHVVVEHTESSVATQNCILTSDHIEKIDSLRTLPIGQ